MNGVSSAALVGTGLDPLDVLSFASGGLVSVTGSSLSVGSVLIGTVVPGYDGIGKPLAIDFTDMVGLPNTTTSADVVLDLVQHLQFMSASRVMTESPGKSRPLSLGFVARSGASSSFILLPLTCIGVPDTPVWGASARVVMATAQTVSGTLACTDTDSGPGSPVDSLLVVFSSLDAANGLSVGDAVVTRSADGWHYLVPWTWTWSGAAGAAGATGGTFRVRAANITGGFTTGFADTTVTIAVTGNGDATLTFISDAPMGLQATGTTSNWHVDFDQRLRVCDQLGKALGADQLQYVLGGSPPPGTTIDPATGTLQIHYSETAAAPTPLFRFTVLVNPVAATATANGILPVTLVIGRTTSGSN